MACMMLSRITALATTVVVVAMLSGCTRLTAAEALDADLGARDVTLAGETSAPDRDRPPDTLPKIDVALPDTAAPDLVSPDSALLDLSPHDIKPPASWQSVTVPVSVELNAVWGSGPKDVFVVGASGKIVHYDGQNWQAQTSPTTSHLHGVWGSGPNDVYAVGSGGTIIHYDGQGWTSMVSNTSYTRWAVGGAGSEAYTAGYLHSVTRFINNAWHVVYPAGSPPGPELHGVWASSPTNVYAAGAGGMILHYDGAGWTQELSPVTGQIRAISGSSSNNIFVATYGAKQVARFDGTSWSVIGTMSGFAMGVWAFAADQAFVVGTGGDCQRYDGSSWTKQTTGTNAALRGVWGIIDDSTGQSTLHVYAVGGTGVVIYLKD